MTDEEVKKKTMQARLICQYERRRGMEINKKEFEGPGLIRGVIYLFRYKPGYNYAAILSVDENGLYARTVGYIPKEVRNAPDFDERMANWEFMTCDGPAWIEEDGKIRKYKTTVYGATDQFNNEGEFLEYIKSLPRVPLRYVEDDQPTPAIVYDMDPFESEMKS